MIEWLVRLKGEKDDLDYLSNLRLTNWCVIEESGRYYLKSTSFNSIKDPCDVVMSATQVLEVVNGTLKLIFGNVPPVNVDGITRIEEDGKRTQFIMPLGFSSEVRFGLAKVVISDDAQSSQQSSIPESWIKVAEQEEIINKALVLYGSLEHNWKNLYMMIEVIEDDVGGEKSLIDTHWAPPGKIKLFKRTANSWNAIGREARHGTAKFRVPPSPMSPQEAQSLIRNIFCKWLQSKCI